MESEASCIANCVGHSVSRICRANDSVEVSARVRRPHNERKTARGIVDVGAIVSKAVPRADAIDAPVSAGCRAVRKRGDSTPTGRERQIASPSELESPTGKLRRDWSSGSSRPSGIAPPVGSGAGGGRVPSLVFAGRFNPEVIVPLRKRSIRHGDHLGRFMSRICRANG